MKRKGWYKMLVIQNQALEVSINELGAELCSIIRKDNTCEYIWQADPTVWKHHAPLLFPIIGRLKDKEYMINGNYYTITQHGFARDLPFKPYQISDHCAEFTLFDNDYTHKMYPYSFELMIRYTIHNNVLIKEHVTRNNGDISMFYEIGGHDAFNISFDGEELTNYYVAFEGTTEIHPIVVDDNVLLSRSHHKIPLKDGRLYLNRTTFANDALMLDDLPVRRITLASKKSAQRVVLDFFDFPYIGIWSKYIPDHDTPFICLEPWSSLPDGSYLGKELEQKIGVRRIEPGQSESLSYSVSVY